MTTASHTEQQILLSMQTRLSAIGLSGRYPNGNRPAQAFPVDSYLIYNRHIPTNEYAAQSDILNYGYPGFQPRPISSSDAGRRRWQQFVEGSSSTGLAASGILRQGASVYQGSGRTSIRNISAQSRQNEKTENVIRHDMKCRGGSIFARYD